MRLINTFTLAAFASSLTVAPLMHADEWDKKTTITINAPMQIPSTTLQPGTYTLKLMESNSDRHIVTVWDKDGMHLITTILAIPNTRLTPTGKSKFTFWETPAGEPAALRAWFYPGDNFGQEFAYPKEQADAIARAHNLQVPKMSEKDEEKYGGKRTEAAKMTTPDPAPTQAPSETTVAATSEPAAEATPAPVAATPAPSPAATASPEAPAAGTGPCSGSRTRNSGD